MPLESMSIPSAVRFAAFLAASAVLVAACEEPAPTVNPTQAALTLDGVPVLCAPVIKQNVCLARAEVGMESLSPGHPPVRSIQVTCDADRCEEDEGAGQVRVFFTDGTHEFVDIAFGRTDQLPDLT